MIDFRTIEYLKSGNTKQLRVYTVLTEQRVFEKLRDFDPVLAGTIPLNIDIETSDLDIICCFADAEIFRTHLADTFSREQDFKPFIPKHPEAVAASFTLGGFVIEIFGQPLPTVEQAAYRHMLVEYTILCEKGEDFRKQVVALKQQGYKTEPAFGKLLGITGDVYSELLKLNP